MEKINNIEFLTPTDSDILRIVKHSPELLKDSFDISRRYNKIIELLNNLTIGNYNILDDTITMR